MINKDDLVIVQCGKCGIHYGIYKPLYNALVDSRQRFCCPFGHGHYFAGGLAEQLKYIGSLSESRARQLAALRGQITRLKKRLSRIESEASDEAI